RIKKLQRRVANDLVNFCADSGQRGTGQIREKVKEDENGIRNAGARSLSSQAGEASGWQRKRADAESRNSLAKQSPIGAWQKTTRQALNTVQADRVKNRAGEGS